MPWQPNPSSGTFAAGAGWSRSAGCWLQLEWRLVPDWERKEDLLGETEMIFFLLQNSGWCLLFLFARGAEGTWFKLGWEGEAKGGRCSGNFVGARKSLVDHKIKERKETHIWIIFFTGTS